VRQGRGYSSWLWSPDLESTRAITGVESISSGCTFDGITLSGLWSISCVLPDELSEQKADHVLNALAEDPGRFIS